MATRIPVITGPGNYDIEVVGESKFLDHFIKICGPRREEGVDIAVQAHLVLDDQNPFDNMAVAIFVDDLQVGFLPRATARDFRRALRVGGLDEKVFECQAHIRGGWDRSNGDVGHYGIWLNLPQDGE